MTRSASPSGETESLFQRAQDLAEELDPTAGDTQAEKQLAEAMVDLRASITNAEGRPDWLGQTQEFRWRAQVVHSLVQGDGTALSRLKNRLRQHYARIVRDRMEDQDLDSAIERIDAQPLPMDGDFFEDLGVYVEERGRKSATSSEAHVLALVAGKLLSLIDPGSVTRGSANTLDMTLDQVVVNQAERLREAIGNH